jgi:2-polyprenyl-3-methyl-5-hydroxy-6-metoxy-1,4-benzoquinol methylase
MCGDPADHHKVLGKRMNRPQGKKPWKKTGITTTVIKCRKCQLIYSNPQPVPLNIQDHYGVPPENYWIGDYFKIDPSYFAVEIARSKKLIGFTPGMKALDIGAGLGKCMIALANAGYDAYGFEPSIPFYERAISQMKISPERLKQGMLEEVDYPENEFHFITFGAVLEHLYDPAASIAKAMKWLKPGGVIQVEVPSSAWLVHRLINFYYKLRGSDYVGNLSPMHSPFHLYEFGLKSFSENAVQNNYEIAFHEYYICKTYMPKFVDFFIRPYMKYTNTGMQLCVWLRKR